MTGSQAFDPDRVIAALNRSGAAYVVVGGLAVAAHGYVRATADLDIVPDPAPENMDRVAACLAALGGAHPIAGELTGAALARPASFKVATRHGDVQVLNRLPAVPPFADLHADRILVALAPDAVAPVCSLEQLVAMKRAAGRERDLADVAELARVTGSG